MRRGADTIPSSLRRCETVEPLALKWLLEHSANPNPPGQRQKYPGTALDILIGTYGRSAELGTCIEIPPDAGCPTKYKVPAVRFIAQPARPFRPTPGFRSYAGASAVSLTYFRKHRGTPSDVARSNTVACGSGVRQCGSGKSAAGSWSRHRCARDDRRNRCWRTDTNISCRQSVLRLGTSGDSAVVVSRSRSLSASKSSGPL